MFTSILSSVEGILSIKEALMCTGASLLCGLIISLCYMFKSTYTKSMMMSLIILPAVVQIVIMLVNGNLGISVAIVGAFSLLRFRSVPGAAKDITAIFICMAAGLATGMGFITYGLVITAFLGCVMLILNFIPDKKISGERNLKVLIPENLDYTTVFDDIIDKYFEKCELMKVKTTDLGSLYELSYRVKFIDDKKEKECLDAIRTRNGNLSIVCSREEKSKIIEEL